MGHLCSDTHPERCINPDGSLCAAWEALLPSMVPPDEEIPTDPFILDRLRGNPILITDAAVLAPRAYAEALYDHFHGDPIEDAA